VGIARVVIRTRQRLAALIARGPVLILDVIRYPHELRDPLDLELPDENAKKAGLDAREIQMAERLVEGMTGKWDPTKYKDEYFDALMGVIEEKAKTGQTEAIAAPDAPERPKAGERDLMALLKKSLDAAESGEIPHLAPPPFSAGTKKKTAKTAKTKTRGTRARAAARGGRWASKRTGRSGTSRARRSRKAK
jgi:DNA end-binding protein Ku